MSKVWNKLDSGLADIYSDYLRVKERGPGGRFIFGVYSMETPGEHLPAGICV